jgi:hypothetical protein
MAEKKDLENIYLQLQIMTLKIDQLVDLVKRPNKEEKDNLIYKSKGNLLITSEEVTNLIKTGHDRAIIDIVIEAIFNYKHNERYGSLFIAIANWLKVDNNRPAFENELLLENGLPPVSEQMRLFPNATPITSEIINNKHIKQDEEKWKEEAFIDPEKVVKQRQDIHNAIKRLSLEKGLKKPIQESEQMKQFKEWKKQHNL